MFNLGFSELIVIGVIALIFIGPKQLPEVARAVGRMINEWKRATSELTSSFKDNEAFKDWEERRQKYYAEQEPEKEQAEPSTPPPVKKEQPDSAQLELNLDQENSSDEPS
jgi:sec-independent protein translocase protein TatB